MTRISGALFILAVLAAIAVAGPSPAAAQEGRPLLLRLFGIGEKPAPPPPVATQPPAAGTPQTAKVIRVPKPANPKNEDAKVVTVIGDGLAKALAQGLDVAFSDTPELRIKDETKSPSGLATVGEVNWPDRLAALLADDPPDVVVVMMGADDRAHLLVDGLETAFRLPDWEKVYTARVRSLISTARQKGIPVYWVGLMPMADLEQTLDMAYLDELYRQAASDAFATYVDVWDAFSDETGAFSASGADVTGQIRQLRLKDGVGFTQSGKRKLAFYAEQEIRAWLKSGRTGPQLPPNAAEGGLVLSLTDPSATAEDELVTGPPPKPKEGSALYDLVVLGTPLPPKAGRVDDLPSRGAVR